MEINISGYKNKKYNEVVTNDYDVAQALYSFNKYTATMLTINSSDTQETLYRITWRA